MTEKIDFINYIPKKIKSERADKEFPLDIHTDKSYITISYRTAVWNSKKNPSKEHSLTIPRFINFGVETFEIIGLLQSEMGKTNNGMINFSNCEYKLINKVIKWFDKELEFGPQNWKWYIRVNLEAPDNREIQEKIREKLISYWLSKTKIDFKMRYPTSISYVKRTNNSRLKKGNYGTLIIERKTNIFSQIVKNLVEQITLNIEKFDADYIKAYLRGILAGESCVENNRKTKIYRIHISAVKKEERDIYQKCLSKLGINSKQYKNGTDIIISRRKNNLQILEQKLMCLSPAKYNKFLKMMSCYPKLKIDLQN